MTTKLKDRLVSYAWAAALTGYLWFAHRFGLTWPALALYAAVGVWWCHREEVLSVMPRPRWHPLHVLGLVGLIMTWPLGVYVSWSER